MKNIVTRSREFVYIPLRVQIASPCPIGLARAQPDDETGCKVGLIDRVPTETKWIARDEQ